MEFHLGIILLSFFMAAGGLELCEEGWIYHGESCFTFITGYYSWKNAEDICRLHKGNIASIHTIDRHIFLHNVNRMLFGMANFTGYKNAYWIGGSDYLQEGDWNWVIEGKSMKDGFTNWYPGYPNVDNKSNCVYFRAYDSKWFDSGCNNGYGVICEKSINYTNAYFMLELEE